MTSETTNPTTHDHASEVTQDVVSDAIVTAGQPKNTQSVQCEVCNVTCNSVVVLEKHKQGKKHLKNLQIVIAPKMPPPPAAVAAAAAAASTTLDGELENDKQIVTHDGGSVNTSIHCDICNVVCSNQDVFRIHVAGKKHSAKAVMKLLGANGVSNPTSEGSLQAQSSGVSQKQLESHKCELCNISCNSDKLLTMHESGKKHQKKLNASGLIPASTDGKPTACDLCGIRCTSNKLLQTHIAGKKHLKNLERSAKPIGPNPATVVTQPASTSNEAVETVKLNGSNGNMKRAGSHEDMETKKQKVLEGGATSNGVTTCTLCNVVCNSPSMFSSHLAGQKHAAMVSKQTAKQLLEKCEPSC